MKKRILVGIINQLILWPIMEIIIIPIFIIITVLLSFMLKNEPAEIGWIFILAGIPFGLVDAGGLPISFLLRIWYFALSLLEETSYFLVISPIITYIYFQVSEFIVVLIFKRDFGKMILRQRIVIKDGDGITKKQVIKRRFCKWNVILAFPIFAIISIVKRENLFYDKETGLTYWDKKAGTEVISA